jgi:hypothetical protein
VNWVVNAFEAAYIAAPGKCRMCATLEFTIRADLWFLLRSDGRKSRAKIATWYMLVSRVISSCWLVCLSNEPVWSRPAFKMTIEMSKC